MSQVLKQLIINLLDSNTVDSIILAKVLYGKIYRREILHGKYDYHFCHYMLKEERIYLFSGSDLGHILYMQDLYWKRCVANPYYE